jgi:hypothetical protein
MILQGVIILMDVIIQHHHHYQPIKVSTAQARPSLWITHKEN